MLHDVADTTNRIRAGKALFLAGDEAVLARLPRGKWIGGTIPYFMDAEGGVTTRDRIFVTEVPDAVTAVEIRSYEEKDLPRIPADAPENGFSFLVLPATSPAHLTYARNAPSYPGLFMKPIIGWIAGVHLSDLGKAAAKTFNGLTGEASSAKAVVLHAGLPKDRIATIGIVNLFRQGRGDPIRLPQEGFSVGDCLIGGKKQNFAEYLLSRRIDTRLPLVADYNGTMVNVSFQAVDEKGKTVSLYAPVFRDVEYRIAEPVADYVKQFNAMLPAGAASPVFSCNCILNYLYSELEGKKTGSIVGPVTFGEIAYQLLNQTLTYLEVQTVR
jgi:hypothetical protein